MSLFPSRRVFAGLAAAAVFAPAAALAAGPDRDAIARRLADAVRRNYQDEAAANRMAAAIAAKAAAGGYAGAADDAAFAAALSADLRAVVNDKHMAVMSGMKAGPDLSDDPVFALRQNYGVQTVRRLAGNVGLIELNFFPNTAIGAPLFDRYAAAMALVADTRALVVDIRAHFGGHPAAVAYFCSYLFDRPAFVVNSIRYRTKATEVFSTTASPRGVRYGEKRPVLITTSADTFSAAEEFAYNLQVNKRARVVGEVTGGGANPNEQFDLGGGFTAFIPIGAAINPVTGTNWEGVGIKPDIAAPADKAVDVALRLALEGAFAQATVSEEQESIRRAIANLPA